MIQRMLKFTVGVVVLAATAVLHAQMAQDPLLSRTAAVEPNIVFMFDDSGSMNSTAMYQYGGGAGYQGLRGPNNDGECNQGATCIWTNPPSALNAPYYGESPDVNRMYYDPRTQYARRINADGSYQAAGSVSGLSSWRVFFYKPSTFNTYGVASVNVTTRGQNYPSSSIIATFPQPPAGGTRATATVQTSSTGSVSGVTINNGGSGYNSPTTVTFSAPPAGGVTATGTVVVASTFRVNGVTLVSRGADYTAATPVTFSAPSSANGVTATGTLTVGATNQVTSATVTAKGAGYTSAPTVVFAAPAAGGILATGTAVLSDSLKVTAIGVTNGGCFASATANGMTVTLTAPGSGGTTATGTATFGAVNTNGCGGSRKPIASVAVNQAGAGYTATPTVASYGTTPATAPTLTVTTGTTGTKILTGVSIVEQGSGYSTAPAITFTGGGGTGAAATATLGATTWITGVNITNAGYGYSTAPTITLGSPGYGGNITTTTLATNTISAINMTNNGAGYSSAPTLTFSGTPLNAAAYTVNMGTSNQITGVTVTNAGSGYITQPAMTLTNTSPGTGATFTVTYTTTAVAPANRIWDGTGTNPIVSSMYFTSSYLPDSGSPLATGADATVVYPNVASVATNKFPKFRNRTECASDFCTWTEERQNYANWKAYHSTRIDLAKTGVGLAFQPLNPTFRLGWGTINSINNNNALDKGVRRYDSGTQSDFLTWLYGRIASPNNSTPNRTSLNKVGTYYLRPDSTGPWATSPAGSGSLTAGTADNTHASCRRAYAMLMTDGYYNETFTLTDVDSSTGPTISQPSTYQYTPVGPYSDTVSGTKLNDGFSDVAMKYWVNDLRPDLSNSVRAVAGDEAYWQHMNFYAIGLGLIGTLDANDPAVLQALTGSSTSTPPRTLSWPTPTANDPKAVDDMWHATINGRGKLLNARTAEELNKAIQQMMSDIGGKEGTQAGVAVSTASLTKDTKKYTPSYVPITWNGNVTAYKLDPNTANQIGISWQVEKLVNTDPVTGAKTYESIIPDYSTRNIWVGNGSTSGTRAVKFDFPTMTSASLIGRMNGTVTANMIDYLRGDDENEDTSASTANPDAIFRARLTRLGDIVNSTPVFVKDSLDMSYELLPAAMSAQATTYQSFVTAKKGRAEGVLFVGANDGMLHAFRDGTYDPDTGDALSAGGVEVFAYVPYSLLPTLNQLSDKAYVHRYYVDGPNVEVDGYLPTAGRWANMVLASTGGGAGAASGSGLSPRSAVFAIDTTSINTSVTGMNASSVMWEVTSSQSAFSELGYVLTDIQAGPTVSGQWVAIFGNGFESKSCQARLFVVNLETGALLKELNTGSGSCGSVASKNGLGGVRVVRNANQQIIGVYAGDLQGNVWKFNLNTATSSGWAVDLGGQPLFTAGSSQPITAAPTALALPIRGTTDPAAGYMVVVGTGKFYEIADISTTSVQSMYGIWDPLQFGALVIPPGTRLTDKSLLVQQTISAGTVGTDTNIYYTVSRNPVNYVGTVTPTVTAPRRGWYIDFPNSGQRLVYPIDVLARRFVLADTISPSNVSLDPCANTSGGTGYLYLVDAVDGSGPAEAVFDTNGDGNIDENDSVVSGIQNNADGRNVALLKSKSATQEVYADVSAGAGAQIVQITCRLTGDCPSTPATGHLKSRQWRQLFLR